MLGVGDSEGGLYVLCLWVRLFVFIGYYGLCMYDLLGFIWVVIIYFVLGLCMIWYDIGGV